MRYFPIFLDLNNKPVLVVGGGEVACRKIDMLLRAGAKVTVVSPKVHPHLQHLAEEQTLLWVKSFYQSDMLVDYIQVWATTDNPELNHRVHDDAKKKNIMVNVVDDKPYCDFITPSMINRGRIQIAVSSGGASPVLIRYLREKLESILPQNLAMLADFGASKRNSIKQELATVDERRKFWERFFSSSQISTVDERSELESLYQDVLNNKELVTGSLTWVEFGQDVEMLSIKSLRLMQESELVLYPENCPFEFVDLCRRDADREQYDDVNQLASLIKQAKADKQRVCVFIEKDSTSMELKLLIGNEVVIKVAQ
ncbi:precorrin-2 dehydrogenase/sirohydrochlorin ferrochelatase family protein [Vibrio rumoiensis]|uniref:precorrin-2 dehydrogenase n=1 Tax=Vibrio rumoiensis 1S-45 TaxID=1188252 RepID=A0A1E5DZ58_9VIBR|nr:bifunctional precorrin-2 dehydrogenase/sirohydrochlorin ferrochelatase [Vibrio rumoiensis]OEF23131.1 ferrochelatase [Vibrio rumoiensis 1S-45]